MKIALIGYGKMGRMIEQLILQQSVHQIVEVIQSSNKEKIKSLDRNKVDVVIEFTSPKSVMENIKLCIGKNIPIVVGTTGWYDKMNEVSTLCAAHDSALVWASNFSIGVNLFFKINQYVATLLNQFPEYQLKVSEIHHTQKKDAPSGTAISIAKDIAGITSKPFDKIIIDSERKGDVVGYHEVKYHSAADEILISHNALNRKGFALGAIHAAEGIVNKKGVFEFKDLINL